MAKPVDSRIQLPDDTTNTGKKVRTQTRVVSGQTVHEHFMVSIRQEEILGVYFCPFDGVIEENAHVFATSGFFWLVNPVGSDILANIRRINIQSNIASALATESCPPIAFTRFSFTGTAEGATQDAAKRKTADASPTCVFATEITGMTLTTQNEIVYFAPPVMIGAADGWAVCPASHEEFLSQNDPTEWPQLVGGEGICCWQADDGTAADTRRFLVNIVWEEIDNS